MLPQVSIFVAAVCESVYQLKKNWPCTEILNAAALSVGKWVSMLVRRLRP